MKESEKRSSHAKPSAPADSDESPKAAKRDGKPATERHMPAIHDAEVAVNTSDNNSRRRRRLQDPLPLEEPPRHGDRWTAFPQQKQPQSAEFGEASVDNVVHANPTNVPRTGHYFQHDDRTAAPTTRNNKRRDYDRDIRMEPRAKARFEERPRDTDARRRSERQQDSSSQARVSESAWTHDKYLETEAEDLDRKKGQAASLERGRPAGHRREFREKPPTRSENAQDDKGSEADKRVEKRHQEEGVDKKLDRDAMQRERERYRERGPELERGRWMDGRYNGRRNYVRHMGDGDRTGGGRFGRNQGSGYMSVADRWSHDRYEELNRSPTPKQEEDHIAQIEALLAA